MMMSKRYLRVGLYTCTATSLHTETAVHYILASFIMLAHDAHNVQACVHSNKREKQCQVCFSCILGVVIAQSFIPPPPSSKVLSLFRLLTCTLLVTILFKNLPVTEEKLFCRYRSSCLSSLLLPIVFFTLLDPSTCTSECLDF